MKADRWDQLAVLFEQAQALPVEERSVFLDEACGDDADLRAQLDALLASYGEAKVYFEDLAGDVFAGPEGEAVPTTIRPPRRVGHYNVLEKLGGGGMGVVYKALDTKLNRFVALKFLPPSLSTDAQAKERFITEARAASALDHINICTIHEIGEAADGQLFIAMAYYQGQTLKKKIQHEALTVEEALDYAVQMASGLEGAHGKSIIHRDVKPANIMVTDRGIVKILDFGLAKMADVQLTQTGTRMGTVAYMSPEQARGETVDHRTDIWSLGVVLYEILAGERPFKGDYDQTVIYAILNETPALLTQVKPDLPEELAHLVAMCLEKERDRRYATVADLLADMRVYTEDSGTSTSVALYAARQQVARRRRIGGGVLGGVLVMLTLLLLIPVTRQPILAAMGMGGTSAQMYVAVLPFMSNIPEDQALADGLMQSLTSLVARLETAKDLLWVIPSSEIVSRGITSPIEARKILGVNTVVQVGVQRIGMETEVNLNLVDPNAEIARITDTVTLPGPLDPAFQEKALNALAGLLKVGLDSHVRQVAYTNRPSSPGAYAFYLQGMGYLQRYDKADNINNAITLFTQAIEEDSLYALAHAGLCEATWEKYRSTTDTSLAEEALYHCNRAEALVEEQPPILVSVASVFLRTGQHKKAEVLLQRALELDPNSADALRWLGRVYEDLALHDRAENAYRQAIALNRGAWINYHHLGALLRFEGRYQEALEPLEQVRRLTPDNYLAYTALAAARLGLNQADEAEQLYLHAIKLQPNAIAYRNLGRLYFRNQQYDKAVQSLEQARIQNKDDLVARNWLGHAYYWAGDHKKANEAWRYVIEQAELKLRINPKDDIMLYVLADAYIALGEQGQGSFYLQRLVVLPQEDVLMQYYIGRIYEMLGQRDVALHWIEQVFLKGFDPVVPDRDPWLEALREDPRYQELRN